MVKTRMNKINHWPLHLQFYTNNLIKIPKMSNLNTSAKKMLSFIYINTQMQFLERKLGTPKSFLISNNIMDIY